MVDHFNWDIKSLTSAQGPGGPPGINVLCAYMPKTMMYNLRKFDERCCYLITDPAKDLKNESSKIISWLFANF